MSGDRSRGIEAHFRTGLSRPSGRENRMHVPENVRICTSQRRGGKKPEDERAPNVHSKCPCICIAATIPANTIRIRPRNDKMLL